MTEQEKAIEEMAREICGIGCACNRCCFNGHCITKLDTAILYKRGYRKTDEEHHTEILNNAIDATFRGAVLRFAEKLKEKAFQGYQVGMYIVDTKTIDETAKEFLKYDK